MRVLLVEDNDINRLYAKSILNQWNCIVDIAENALVAIEKIKYNFYDVVLMDVQMPVMDGYEATRAIRLMDSHMQDRNCLLTPFGFSSGYRFVVRN